MMRPLMLLSLFTQALGDPACSANIGCQFLSGDCCPALGGMMLACCADGGQQSSSTPYQNQYSGMNPLGIVAEKQRSRNYFLILGDWGRAHEPGPCQLAVAEHMKAYVARRESEGKKLLFVATTGDNFYWKGVIPSSWEQQWSEPYGSNEPSSPLYKVPWLATLGNHDFGDDDAYAACPSKQSEPLAMVVGQAYGSRQMNSDKNPSRPNFTEHYWLPDYNYHYEIPAASLEVIAIDTNVVSVHSLGGDLTGHQESFASCGGEGNVQAFLQSVHEAGLDLLRQRARVGTATTVLIIQHYPGECHRDVFEASLPTERVGKVQVLCSYGHVHSQECHGWKNGVCDTILSGGGGGCCYPEINTAGFAAVELKDDGGFNSDVDSEQVIVPPGCQWRRRLLHA
mmetsp:Transcript_2390/g.4364  ORF Transcript_2390/g.4364 Transcript_2390/m.4364 type:complete len:397 (-) Transcript_2390:201-1391(-)